MEFHPSSSSRTSRTPTPTRNPQNQLLEPNSPSLPPSTTTSSSPHWPPPSDLDFEPMFEKVVTPSDVGKLNRLVIPKQHAERFFPLDPSSSSSTTSSSTTTTTTVGGLLLSFEERRSGKPWRFRYSYWNSSQSYVMTKGWSRFVKEKHLSAGDTVSFSRSISDTHRLFIDWRRRPLPPPPPDLMTPLIGSVVSAWGGGGGGIGGGMLHYFPQPPIPHHHHHPPAAHFHPGMYFRSVGPTPQQQQHHHLQMRMVDYHGGGGGTILESVPVVAHGPTGIFSEGQRRRPRSGGVRLFGVDLDHQDIINDDDDEDEDERGRGRRMNTELQLMPPQS